MMSETSGLLFTKNKDGSIRIEVIYYDWDGKDCDHDHWYDLNKENADKLYYELSRIHSGTFEEMLLLEFTKNLDIFKFEEFCRKNDIAYIEMSWTNLG